jgi:hypothetical protein
MNTATSASHRPLLALYALGRCRRRKAEETFLEAEVEQDAPPLSFNQALALRHAEASLPRRRRPAPARGTLLDLSPFPVTAARGAE